MKNTKPKNTPRSKKKSPSKVEVTIMVKRSEITHTGGINSFKKFLYDAIKDHHTCTRCKHYCNPTESFCSECIFEEGVPYRYEIIKE